ncbi:signal peptidase I [Treponema medium]|uniref:signal peptidase I n=1 Tax=Treponema medium TaxID=58231 RepID=UPI00197E699A|nr:signal peptidase I [Treponema medium]QSH91268.1 signal peptidase I [Treponema medium]
MFFQRYKFTSYTERRAKRFKILRIAFIVFLLFILYQLISSYIIATYRIQADTMQPTFSSGDMIITTPFYSTQKDIERGTLVMVEPIARPHQNFFEKTVQKVVAFFTFQLINPFASKQPSQAKPFVRRVVGIPGDTIYMEDFVLHIKTKNGGHFLTEFEVTENDYNVKTENLPENWDTTLPFSGAYPEIMLKEGEYFVLCDNRIASSDSRLWGPLQMATQIKGRILMQYWPFSRIVFF